MEPQQPSAAAAAVMQQQQQQQQRWQGGGGAACSPARAARPAAWRLEERPVLQLMLPRAVAAGQGGAGGSAAAAACASLAVMVDVAAWAPAGAEPHKVLQVWRCGLACAPGAAFCEQHASQHINILGRCGLGRCVVAHSCPLSGALHTHGR
jgi:hypothetical protein